jgi:uncharacterized protein YggE
VILPFKADHPDKQGPRSRRTKRGEPEQGLVSGEQPWRQIFCVYPVDHSSWKENRMLKSLAVLLGCCWSLQAAWGQPWLTPTPSTRVAVSGSAEVRVVPDEVVLEGAVADRDPEHHVAAGRVNERTSAVLKYLQANGIDVKDLQVDSISIMPVFDGHSPIKPIAYDVRKGIVVRVRDLSKFDMLLTGAIGAGLNVIEQTNFRTTKLRQYRDYARSEAVQAAKEKARAMSQALGIELGDAKTFELDDTWGDYHGGGSRRAGGLAMQNTFQELGEGGEPVDEAFAAGRISVTARVTVWFELRDKNPK